MSDGASAPAGAPAAPVTSATAAAPAKAAEPKPWGPDDESSLLETLKRSPYAKRRVNGKDEAIGSLDDLKRWQMDSQRGAGANRVVEEANKTKAEAEAMRKRLEKAESYLERIRARDASVLEELGGHEAQPDVTEFPPEARKIAEENRQLRERIRAAEEAQKAELEKQETTKAEQAKRALLTEATEHAKSILADVSPEALHLELPGVIAALERLKREGLRLGRDYTPEQLKSVISEEREKGVFSRLDALKPESLVQRVGPRMAKMTPEALESALGDSFVPVVRALVQRWQARAGTKRVPTAPAPTNGTKPAQSGHVMPLTPMKI